MVFARDARSKQRIWIEMLILDPSRVYLIDPTFKKTPKSFHSWMSVEFEIRCAKFTNNKNDQK